MGCPIFRAVLIGAPRARLPQAIRAAVSDVHRLGDATEKGANHAPHNEPRGASVRRLRGIIDKKRQDGGCDGGRSIVHATDDLKA